MMRGPSNWSVAVRKPDGEIAQLSRPIVSPMTRHWALRLPIIRGVVALGESLAIGFRALAISANYAAQEEGDEEVSTELTRGQLIFAFAIAIGFAILLFKVGPALHEALAAGQAVDVICDSVADGLNAPFAGENAVAICRGRVDSVLVSEGEIETGFRFLYSRAKLACEPAGAAAAAALLAGKVPLDGANSVAVVVSGGNVAAETTVAILAER